MHSLGPRLVEVTRFTTHPNRAARQSAAAERALRRTLITSSEQLRVILERTDGKAKGGKEYSRLAREIVDGG